mmetsp:Transcript_13825/g.25368  ORF Transcript_13825/g.25368 Transcript_13825/m.25368 type:complete len:148 (-) Transcript_13825:50-493(-)
MAPFQLFKFIFVLSSSLAMVLQAERDGVQTAVQSHRERVRAIEAADAECKNSLVAYAPNADGVKALQDCVVALEEYAKAARSMRSESEDANKEYRKELDKALEDLKLALEEKKQVDISFDKDQHEAYAALDQRLSRITAELDTIRGM